MLHTDFEGTFVDLQVTAHAYARLAFKRAADFVNDHVVGQPVLLVDFHCFKVPERLIKTHAQMQESMRAQKDKAFVTKGAQDFVFRMCKTSGVSDATGIPEGAIKHPIIYLGSLLNALRKHKV